MPSSNIEEIELCFTLDDDAEDLGSEADAERELFASRCTANVLRLGNDLFRTAEPVSLTPFGPLGPMLDLGTVFEALPHEDGSYTYVRTLEEPAIWSHRLVAGQRPVLKNARVNQLLDSWTEAGGSWELMTGSLSLQVPNADGESEPPAALQELVRQLDEMMKTVPESLGHGEPSVGGRLVAVDLNPSLRRRPR